MNYYIIYNYMPLKVKVIKLNGLDQRYIKHDNEYYIKITKARYIKLKRKLDSKLKKEFNEIIELINYMNYERINEKRLRAETTEELDRLSYTYDGFYNVLKTMPIKFFKTIDKKYEILYYCEHQRDFYGELYRSSLIEVL